MGAALTYARRYALFTLVGIAGEDDLDAPEHRGADERRRRVQKRDRRPGRWEAQRGRTWSRLPSTGAASYALVTADPWDRAIGTLA